MAQTRTFQRHALLPKPQDRTRFVPVIPQDAGLAFLLGDLAPEERRTLAEIVDRSDLLMVNERPWLLIQASPDLLDRLLFCTGEIESDAVSAFVADTKCRVLVKPFDLRTLASLSDDIAARRIPKLPLIAS